MKLPKYPTYRHSGLEWLGETPAHWVGPSKLGTLSSLKGRLGWQGLKAEEYLAEGPYVVSSAHFLDYRILWDECPRVSQQRYDTDSNIQLAAEDILLMKDGAAMGKLAFVENLPGDACLNSHLLLFRPLSIDGKPAYFPKFAFYFMQTGLFQEHIRINGTGATFLGISQEAIARYQVVWPPLSEQASIAAFLDNEIVNIDTLIAEQEKLLVLLAEKRQATISHAVTRGLNPDAPMKDSGVAWLGEVPAHWTVRKAGYDCNVLSGFAFPSSGFSLDDSDVKLLRGVNVGVGTLRWDDIVYWNRAANDGLDPFELRPGDIVLGMDRPWISEGLRVARVSEDDIPCLLLQRVAAIRPGTELNADYLYFLFHAGYFFHHCSPEMTGVSVPHISAEQIRSFVIPVPPVDEQSSIVAFVATEYAKLDALGGEARRSIALLKERRSALIAAAVTGKIDVRNALPQELAA
ncbi:type I restriction enzyme S subunit [Paraburkholderia phenoliruptrix]|uniref:restriction endonuclease subunit S n=1 Tax=Paraburkholderia phenoliruptrix TaxID=252970 RepID=UPI0028675513|nr:restriction endonuclease subunit S [Paraburkholderia phenoliruptrix]MDR6420515.1 type I restriction enzyme S subunit [Paraburkholderia phenoliruptrix]